MKFTRALTAFAVLTLALLNAPAWGGGWESSGSPARSPVMTPPVDYLPYTCMITVQRYAKRSLNKVYHYTEVLKPEHFERGYAHIVTPSFKGLKFLEGQDLLFWGYDRGTGDGSLEMRLTGNIKSGGQIVATSESNSYAPMSKREISAKVELSNPKTHESIEVEARCSETARGY
jgi:hypothetical protein